MNYKVTEKDNEVFFRYMPSRNNKKTINKKSDKENPFGILKNLNLN
jgi:ATP-dependent RNA helicase SUPV3L1/SUV3